MSNYSGPRWTAAATALLVASVLAVSPPTTAASDSRDGASKRPSCLGKPATIVGTPDARVVGTKGPDVIVSNGANTVAAGAGDDRVCITGTERGNAVRAGSGNDRIVNKTQTAGVVIVLGSGRDWYQGGPATDAVRASGGDDTIALGPGADSITDVLTRTSKANYNGGPGNDRLRFITAKGLAGPVVVDTARREIRIGPRTAVRSLTGVEVFELGDDRKVTSFLGSGAAEEVTVEGRIGTVQLRGGDDSFTLDRSYPLAYENRFTVADGIRGGTGTDLFRFTSRSGNLVVDLLEGYMEVVRSSDTKRFTITGFNSLDLNSTEADIRGTADANIVSLISCQGTVEVLGGNDTVRVRAPYNDSFGYYCVDETTGMTLLGGDGDDTLVGGSLNDAITGGDGTDLANGSDGADQCEAESVENCESGILS